MIKSKFLSDSSINTLLAILKVTDARRDAILTVGLYHRFPWRHLPPHPPGVDVKTLPPLLDVFQEFKAGWSLFSLNLQSRTKFSRGHLFLPLTWPIRPCRMENLIQPIKSTTQICVVTRHQYGISALVSQTSFGGKTSGGVAKCRLFSQASRRWD